MLIPRESAHRVLGQAATVLGLLPIGATTLAASPPPEPTHPVFVTETNELSAS